MPYSRWSIWVALAGIGLVAGGVFMVHIEKTSKEYCILINGEALCPGTEIKLDNHFTIEAGFAPNSKHWPKLKPKWHYFFRFGVLNRLDHDAAVAQAGSNEEYMAYLWMAKDYCIYQNKPYLAWKWPQLIICMNQCYEGDFLDNPYYTRQYGGDTPDFGPQDHSKRNNPFDQGLEYENFCLDPKPPILDTPSPQIRQGADAGLEPKLSFDLLDTNMNMDIAPGSNDLDPFFNDSDFLIDGTNYPSENHLDSNEIADTGPLDLGGDFSIPGNMDQIGLLANNESADPEENLFLDPGNEGSDYMFASLERRSSSSSSIRYDSEGELAVPVLPTLAADSGRKSRRQLSARV